MNSQMDSLLLLVIWNQTEAAISPQPSELAAEAPTSPSGSFPGKQGDSHFQYYLREQMGFPALRATLH